MDGLEYKRTKFNKWVQKFVFWEERMAVKHSHYLIADNMGQTKSYEQRWKMILRGLMISGMTMDDR